MKHKLFFTVTVLFSVVCNSQIAITEVYYDTPYTENLSKIQFTQGRHHRGEFIELYNYSDTDINLAGWYLMDRVSVFYFSKHLTIKSGEFLIVAYGETGASGDNGNDYFPYYFSTVKGKKGQIIYQNKIMLRNKREDLYLVMGQFRGQKIKFTTLHEMSYDNPSELGTGNYQATLNPQIFYDTNSLNLTPAGNYVEKRPNPLEAEYKPPITKLEEISTFINAVIDSYANLNWSENVLALTKNRCPVAINLVQQPPAGTFTGQMKCFSYDNSGNRISAADCGSANTGNPNPNAYTAEELEAVKGDIVIVPNPTYDGQASIQWKGAALGKIVKISVAHSAGGLVFEKNISSGETSVSFSVAGQLPGVLPAQILLNTGQAVSKNLLKL